MSTSRLIITVFFIACRPAGEEWISEDIHHDTQLDTGESGDDSVLLSLVTGAVEIIPKTSIDGEIEIVIGCWHRGCPIGKIGILQEGLVKLFVVLRAQVPVHVWIRFKSCVCTWRGDVAP